MPLQSLLNASRILLRGISQVFLQGDPRLGLACLLAIAVGAPPLLAGALLAAPSARCWRACCTAPTATSRPGCTATTPC
ncbi:urea transporter [Pseudomonas aeruginosa]|nr:urea transporter [Pseudomonas aeruginosa]MDF5995912.1 urea transporter [Pseudomonas aeruginosa]